MTFILGLLGGLWRIARALPWWLYAVAIVLFLAWRWHAGAVNDAHTAGDQAARRELAPMLMQLHADLAVRYIQAADAEGRALTYEAGLNACIGERTSMATITSAVLAQHQRSQAQAQRELNATRQELANAYDSNADGCAAQPVPAAVLSVLDAATGQASTDTHSGDPSARAAVRADPQRADSAHACTEAHWLDLPAYDRLGARLQCEPAALQQRQGEHREPAASRTERAAVTQDAGTDDAARIRCAPLHCNLHG